jgi:hypothetical protein
MVRRSLAAGIWLVMTVTATLIVWAAVSVVAADVTDRPAPVVAHHDVVVALQAGSEQSTTTTVAPAPPSTSALAPRSTVTSRPTTSTSGRSGPPGSIVGAVATTTIPAAPPTTKAPQHPPVSTTTTTTTMAPSGGTATFTNAGGSVAVACTSSGSIRLVAAFPADGFQAVVWSGGPFVVQVNFVGQGRNLPISAACVFGQPFRGNDFQPGG